MTRFALLCSLLALACAPLARADDPPAPVSITLDAPAKVMLPDARRMQVRLRITNRSQDPVVIYGVVRRWRLVNADSGKAIPRSHNLGRFGGGGAPACMLELHPFVKLAPGKTHTISSYLSELSEDPGSSTGYKLTRLGRYQVHADYSYRRAMVERVCTLGCVKNSGPQAPWNRAVELSLSAKATFEIVPPSAEVQRVSTRARDAFRMMLGISDPAGIDRLVCWPGLHASAVRSGHERMTLDAYQARARALLAKRWKAVRGELWRAPSVFGERSRQATITGDRASCQVSWQTVLLLERRDGDGWKVVGFRRLDGPLAGGGVLRLPGRPPIKIKAAPPRPVILPAK